MNKYIFIVNPVAGQGKSLKISTIIEHFCQDKHVDYEIIHTHYKNEATELIKTLGSGNIIYSVGGDGTLKEVVNGIYGTNNILGVIPAGSGNDFNKTLDTMPKGIHNIDLGIVNEQFFINIASLGLDAEVANNVELMKQKRIPNNMLYNASILYSLSKRKDPTINIFNTEQKLTLMAICNGKYYGHGFQIAPEADIQDGFFDICMVDSLKTYQIPGIFLKLLHGTHIESKHVNIFWDSCLKIQAKQSLVCNVDGEIIKGKNFNFNLLPKAIRVDNSDELGIKKHIKKYKF